jgi:PAS domain-containing protein
VLAGLLNLGAGLLWLAAVITATITVYRYGVLPIKRFIERQDRLAASIGENGNETLFQTVHDLSDRMAMLQAHIDADDQLTFRLQPDGRVDYVSPAFARFTGWSLEYFQRHDFRDLLDWNAKTKWDEAIRRRNAFSQSCSLKTARGREIRAPLQANPVPNGEKFLGWCCALDWPSPSAEETT